MDEYIKRETALKAIDEYFRTTNPDGDEQIGVLKSRRIIRALPSADVAPVRHGKWKWKNSPYDVNIYTCSVCEKQVSILGNKLRYCPNCGAKMDGDGNG